MSAADHSARAHVLEAPAIPRWRIAAQESRRCILLIAPEKDTRRIVEPQWPHCSPSMVIARGARPDRAAKDRSGDGMWVGVDMAVQAGWPSRRVFTRPRSP